MKGFVQNRNQPTAATPMPAQLGQNSVLEQYSQIRHQFSGTPPLAAQSGQKADFDRKALGRDAKVSTKKTTIISQAPSRVPSTAPADFYSPSQYAEPNNIFGDEPVSSNFDQTMNEEELQGDGEEQNGKYLRGQEYSYPRHAQSPPRTSSQHRHNQDFNYMSDFKLESQENLRKSQITGRFDQALPQQTHTNLQLRSHPEDVRERQPGNTKKRTRSHGRKYDPPAVETQKSHKIDGVSETELPGLPVNNFYGDMQLGHALLADSDEMDSMMSDQSEPQQGQEYQRLQEIQQEQEFRAPPVLPEWSEEDLKSIEYSKVQAMSWETGKKKKISKVLRGKPLEEKIRYHMNLLDQQFENEHKRDDVQFEFYRQMSTAEWEQAGKWFVGQFGETVNRVMAKKAEKRELTEKYEAELDARVKAVRGKSRSIDKKMKDMRVSGEEVLKGRSKSKAT